MKKESDAETAEITERHKQSFIRPLLESLNSHKQDLIAGVTLLAIAALPLGCWGFGNLVGDKDLISFAPRLYIATVVSIPISLLLACITYRKSF